jgi:hypothetical protein
VEFTLDEGHDAEDIPTIGLVTILVADLTHIVTWCLGTPTLAVHIFSAEGELILVVLSLSLSLHILRRKAHLWEKLREKFRI